MAQVTKDLSTPGNEGVGNEGEVGVLAAPVLAQTLIFLMLNAEEVGEIRSKMPHCTPTEVWAQGKGK
jgi:hypothetical protein